MNGTVEVTSLLGRGSTFIIELPEARTAAADRPAAGPEVLLGRLEYGRTMRVLYVDDLVDNVRLLLHVVDRFLGPSQQAADQSATPDPHPAVVSDPP